MVLEIALVGISHKEADLDLRGQLSLTTSKKREMYHYFMEAGIADRDRRSRAINASLLRNRKSPKNLYDQSDL